ncbi:MAG: ricin-type beta-trefoil lectin domain protein [Bauldia sp.]
MITKPNLFAPAALVAAAAALAAGSATNATAQNFAPIVHTMGRCLDVSGRVNANGTNVQIYDCNGTGAQDWAFLPNGAIQNIMGRCLDVTGAVNANGTNVQVWDCNNTAAQIWTYSSDGVVRNALGRCLDVAGAINANFTNVQIWDCNGTAAQRWTAMAQRSALYPSLPATYGEVTLAGGFSPDPFRTNVAAGGTINAAGEPALVTAGCRGYAAAAPDYKLYYTPGAGYPLFISVIAAADTTLIINDPSGNWVCNDDTIGHNPVVNWSNPLPGRYDIWVATFSRGANHTATLRISEFGGGP